MKNCLLLFASMLLLISCSSSKPANNLKFIDTSKLTLAEVFPKDYTKMAPGCIPADKFEDLKIYLKNKCKVDLDSVGIVNIFYIMPLSKCGTDIRQNEYLNTISQTKNYHFAHTDTYTNLSYPIVFLQHYKEPINSNWIVDNALIFDLFLNEKYEKRIRCEALLTINKDRSYFLDWEGFNPKVYNAFSNELLKHKCD
ncbi:hypothetical protein [Flavobacterium sp.]|jgi:hypothetical protein|uniref:hypothetical protein n=1 Tax=Flavobacterium sp. TaxID=239 RepID=UPI0037BED31D